MSEEESVTTWLTRLKTGRTDAAGEIWQRYVERLVRLARRKLGRHPRRAADEEDVALLAFDAFLRGVREGRFLKLNDRDDLWQVLVLLSERQAIALRRRELALKRGGGGVRGESVFGHNECNGSHRRGLDQKSGREAAPDFAAETTEQLRYLLHRLADDTQRRIALGKLEGKSNKELGRDLGISQRAVERKLAMIRDKWRSEHGDG